MKLLLITAAALFLGACAYEPPTCGLPNELVVVGQAKDGNLIYDDQAPLSSPCPAVERPQGTDTPKQPQPPTPEPPVDNPPEPEPKPEKVKHPNSGRGNGSEGDPDVDPGNSGGRNNGGD
jgi:hypothetical protein